MHIGATSELFTTIPEHISKVYPNSFTAKYNCNKLVYYETFGRIEDAIAKKTTEKMESIIEAEIDFGFQFRAERVYFGSKIT